MGVELARRRALERTAYHEAGHAVAAFILKRGTRKLTIVPDAAEGSLGAHWASDLFRSPADVVEKGLTTRQREGLERAIIVLAAGAAAEALFVWGVGDPHSWTADVEHATLAMRLLGIAVDEFEPYLSRCHERACRIVCENEDLVHAVVADLLERKTLTGKQVRDVMRAAVAARARTEKKCPEKCPETP